MLPRGRPPSQHSQQYPGPSGYGMSFNQYPQNFPQGAFGGQIRPRQQFGQFQQSQNFNRQKRDRARPRYQYSYYSDESLNSSASGNNMNSRGGFLPSSGVGRGGGLINASSRSLPISNQFQDRRQHEQYNTNAQRTYSRSSGVSGGNRSEQEPNPRPSPRQSTENRNVGRVKRDNQGNVAQFTMYFCPKCGENYNSRHVNNRYVGKIPLILQCKHTMCQECSYQDLKNYKVNCPVCQTDSVLTQEQTPVCQSDMQNIFLPNFYILGVMSYYRSQGGYLKNLENMAFVSTESKKAHPSLPDPSDRCCFATCTKEATMFCPSCEGIYCSDCCTVVHKITKKMMSHEPVFRRKEKFSFMLENCGEHPTMQVEFFCKTCDLTACCYCVLDKHNADHERVALYQLNNVEMEEFKRLKKEAEKALKEVLAAQKKAARLTNFDTRSVKKDMCQYFVDCHAKLEHLEKQLCQELETFKASNRGLDNIQTSLEASAQQLKQLVAFNEDKIGDRKLNLRGALRKLKDLDKIPRFLLTESGQSEPIIFTANNSAIESLEDDLVLEKCADSEYRLVTDKDLPEDYILDIDESDTEIEEAISGIINKSNQNADLLNLVSKTSDMPIMVAASTANSVISKRTLQKEPAPKRKLGKDMERVDVQHINSMDSFFVQYKKDQAKLSQLNKDIENYVKMGGAEAVQQPQLNDLYLALYVNETHNKNQKEQKWCRARLTEIKNGENGPIYELFFIDYGKTQIVDGNRIKDIPAFLTQKKPFAYECILHNPMGVNWNKKAHYSLAKILNGKDVYMMEKSYNQGIYEVDLMIASSDGGITSVTDILVHAHSSVEPHDETGSLDGDGSVSMRKDGYFPALRLFPNSKKFTKSQKEKVIIATVVDPQNIFVHMVQYQESFKAMCRAIKKTYRNAKSSGCIPIEGTYVLVEYKDPIRLNWHRAFVKSVDMNSNKVHVLLVDWGLNVVVSSSNIRPLQESFTKLECQAVLIKLAHIAPYNKQHVWSSHTVNFLQSYHKSQSVLKMVVQETEPELEVALFDVSGNVDVCINALMVENNLADSVGPISSQVHWPQFEISNPEFSEEDGLMSSLLRKVDEQISDDSDEDLPGVKKRQVDVVKVEGPDLVWLKFLEFRNRERDMFKELQIHYSEVQERSTKTAWKVGEQCVAEVGHEYARGKIVEVVGEEYKIYLFDKVKEITAPLDKIYTYNNYFAKFPQAVTKCHLANIRPAGDTGKWSISSVEALQQIFTKHKRIYASKAPEIESELSPKKSLPLDMWYGLVIQGGALDPDKMKYVSINNSLVKLGFAYKVPRPPAPKPAQVKSLLRALEVQEPSEQPDQRTSPVGATAVEEVEVILETRPKSKSPQISKKDQQGEKTIKLLKKAEPGAKSPQISKDQQGEKAIKILKKAQADGRSPGTKSPEICKDEQGEKAVKLLEKAEPDGRSRGAIRKVKPRKSTHKEVQEVPIDEDKNTTKSTEAEESKKSEEIEQPKKVAEKKSKEVLVKGVDGEEPVLQNWIAIVEQELGEAGAVSTDSDPQEKPAKGSDDSEKCVESAPEDSPYYKTEIVIDDWLPPFRLTKKEFRARVTCVETGGHLYLHEEGMDDVYYKMEANIKAYFDTNHPEVPSHKWEPGDLCTIKYSDGNWYRGKILKAKSPDEISVFMIDFGSDHNLSSDVLFREVLYVNVESFATRVKLDKVYARSGQWLTSDYDHFHDLITDWCRIVVKGPLDVELPLVDVYNERGEYVNQKLKELCPNLSRCSNFPIQGADEEEEDDTVVIESYEYDRPYADEMLMDSFNNELDLKNRTLLRNKYLPEDCTQTLTFSSQSLPDDLLEGKKVVMEIGNISNFDGVILRRPEGDVSEEMYNLITEIQEVVDSLPDLKEFAIGVPCLAPYSVDDVWYRARIIDVKDVEGGFVDVMFVDYGNSEAVSTKKVKMIRSDYLNLPQQSWAASVNVALTEDADVIEVMKLMKSLEGKRKYVKLVRESPLTVDLYEKDGELCYETLISDGALKSLQIVEISP